MHSPSMADIRRIALINNPVLRNVLITQSYYELSEIIMSRTGAVANWCTFATWASRQAGQSIRKEDLQRTLEARVDIKLLKEFQALIAIASEMGIGSSISVRLHALVKNSLFTSVVDRIGEAVAKGNKKVFEEIGFQFARFIAECFDNTEPDLQRCELFCREMLDGDPPDGQQYLKRAFTNYYMAFFERDEQLRLERLLLANLQIGFHEQTRLQPEILESLNAAFTGKDIFRKEVIDFLFPPGSWLSQVRFLYLKATGKTSRLEAAIDRLIMELQHLVRKQITAYLMTLNLPHESLLLSKDLQRTYPKVLSCLSYKDLVELMAKIDTTPESLKESGAEDWADLTDRMHFITELFRCYQFDEQLYEPAFKPEQVEAMKRGEVPMGRL
ncbi:hypothetical protein [Chitinophaga filiformis]|uniref:Uncharacterized protein n=1 Tax=Chitinophaga filiformis TaxID=104663 RepID=A0A1G7SVK4_CHIFI|nr:hypothetical protein [Chitinophaga filiformis]SDG26892.1 hypothetical protein SAMN04488121_1031027 [Chitinophaga filiformis]